MSKVKRCTAHGCSNVPVVRFELLLTEDEKELAKAMDLNFEPTYCPFHAVDAEGNPTMRFKEGL